MTANQDVRVRILPGVASVGAVVAALLLFFAVVAITGHSAVRAAEALFDGSLGSTREVSNTLLRAIPTILVALGWIVATAGGRISLGFEGQVAIGGILASVVALHVHGVPIGLHLPLAVVAGIIGGALWVSIAAWMWISRGASEVITTLMLNFVALSILGWVVRGPLQEETGFFPYSDRFPSTARWPRVFPDYPLGYDIVLAIVATAAVAWLLRRTAFGLRLRLTGANERAGRQSGIRTVRIATAGLLVSGALGGLAGSSMVLSGTSTNLNGDFTAGVGFTGIVVALIARNRPTAVIPAAILLAGLSRGGGLVETRVGVPQALVIAMQAVVIFFVAASAHLVTAWTRRTAPGAVVHEPVAHVELQEAAS